jgi:hypothetical protein
MAFSDHWFRRHHARLVWALNAPLTRGLMRDLLDIPLVPDQPIVGIGPSHVIGLERVLPDGLLEQRGVFSSGPVYAMRVYKRGKALWWAMHYWDALFPDRFPDWVLAQRLSFGLLTLTVDPDAGTPGTTSVDGAPGRAAVESWASIRAGGGNFATATSVAVPAFRLQTSGSAGFWSQMIRGIFHFDTSALTSSATISAATFRLYCTALTDTLSIANDLCVVASTVTSDNTLANSDYQSIGSTEFASRFAWASWSTSAYNDLALNATGIAAVSLTGVTKIATRADDDLDNTEPSVSFVDGNKNEPTVQAADNGSNEPQLDITYTLPSGSPPRRPSRMMTGMGR